MRLLPRATLHSDGEQLPMLKMVLLKVQLELVLLMNSQRRDGRMPFRVVGPSESRLYCRLTCPASRQTSRSLFASIWISGHFG
jgi:hypothetical protein